MPEDDGFYRGSFFGRRKGHKLKTHQAELFATLLPRLSFDAQGVYEFAFNVVPTGNDTVFAELKTLGPDEAVELTDAGSVAHPLAKPLPEAAAEMPLAERIARQRAALAAIVRPHVAHYGNRIFCPLSGGLDSRLLLALLREAGAAPCSRSNASSSRESMPPESGQKMRSP